MTKIYCISTKNSVLDFLRETYANQELEFLENWPKVLEEWGQVHYLLIIEPVKIGRREYYSLSKLWKNWLFRHAPHVKLLLATHGGSNHTNVIDLLNLPSDLVAYCKAVPAVSDFIPRRKPSDKGQKSIHFDPWFADLPLSGMDAKTEIERFLNGHDQYSSFYSQMVTLRNQLMNLHHFWGKHEKQESEKVDEYKRYVKDSQAHLQNRWHQYEHLVEYLPFSIQANELNTNLNKLKKFLRSKAWKQLEDLPDLEWVDAIRDTAREHFVPYVFTGD